MRKGEWTALMRKKQYVIAGSLVVIAAVGMTAIHGVNQAKEQQKLEQELAQNEEHKEAENVAAETENEASAASSVVEPAEKSSTDMAGAGTEIAEIAELDSTETEEGETEAEETRDGENGTSQANATSETLHFAAENGILWPMEGDVILNYSMDSTVYFATLDQYKYNPAVIISGQVNDKVTSVAKGQVSEIENSEVTGCTVKVDLGDGYEAIYGQLKEVNFAVGDYVESGHVIGYIGEPTKYFAVEGSNLYFELRKDGIPIDPIEFFE